MPRTRNEDVADLGDQVKRLARSTTRLHRVQERLDQELSLRRQLHELWQRTSGSFSLLGILEQIPNFATRELGYQRAVVFLDDRNVGTFTVRTFDGYHTDELRKQVNAAQVASGDTLPALLRAKGIALYDGWAAQADLNLLAKTLTMANLLALPLLGSTKNLIGLFVAGNADSQTRVDAESRSAQGLRMLAEQSGWAVNNCILHWEVAVERNLLEAKIAQRTEELRRASEQIQEDLERARKFQHSIFQSPPTLPTVEVEVIYRPCALVGGDLYDVETLADDRILAFVADATGHGVDAALTTMFIKSEYELVKRRCESPVDLLAALNDSIASHYGRLEMRFTAACALVDLARHLVTYASAGHPPSCLWQAGRVRELGGGGPFMGVMAEMTFPQWSVPFNPNDGLYLFTDGIFEVWNRDGAVFGEERVYAAIARASQDEQPAGAAVCAELQRHAAGHPMDDDITFVGIGWKRLVAKGGDE